MSGEKIANEMDEVLSREPEVVGKPRRTDMLSLGSTMLNLACTGNPFGGLLKGKYFWLVGDSTSGKTFLSMTCFAEATINKRFKSYRLIYDNVEDGCLLDLEHLFNKAVAERVEPPAEDAEGKPIYSHTVEEFYYHLTDAVKAGEPFIYVLDSENALTSEQEGSVFEKSKEAHEEGRAAPGSYGDGKAKKHGQGIRQALKGLRDSGSILIVVSQTRDSMDGYKTASGGRALKFYSTVEIWTSVAEAIIKTVKGKARKVGVHVRCQIKKNRITGKTPEVFIDIYPSFGIDDLGGCVDFLVEEGWWTLEKQSIVAKGLSFKGTREKLIAHIEKEGLVNELRAEVGKCWKAIEDACALQRKNLYGQAQT